ncbi:MAG TPA: cyclic nucleotide-binding domain-containing protein [Acidimicrobiales bacterium]|nr:cyclic nucleotide-binding domain-containing protein [Acidimicrobiales bacterium]
MGRVPKGVIETLRQVPLFADCTDKELRSIAGLGTPVTLAPDRELTRPGERGSEFFVIVSGKAVCELDGAQMADFGPGDFFGEMALLDGKPRSAQVKTVSEVEALVLDRREFVRLVESSPALALKMLASMASRLRQTNASVQH